MSSRRNEGHREAGAPRGSAWRMAIGSPGLHMLNSTRAVFLTIAAALMLIGAAGFTFVLLPDLHGDLVEIGVRPTVLGGTVVHLYFTGLAMFGFALIAGWASIQSVRGVATATLPLAVAAVVEVLFGAMAYSSSHSPHHLGSLASGVLLWGALFIPDSARRTV